MENCLYKLWLLRGKLENAFFSKDCIKLSEIKSEYEDFIKNITKEDEVIFLSYKCIDEKKEIKKRSIEYNKTEILFNIMDLKFKALAEGLEIKPILPKMTVNGSSCQALDVWILRAMYDKCCRQKEAIDSNIDSDIDSQNVRVVQNKNLRDAVVLGLDYLSNGNFGERVLPIREEIKENFKRMYGISIESPKLIRNKLWLMEHYESIKANYIELDENLKDKSLNM